MMPSRYEEKEEEVDFGVNQETVSLVKSVPPDDEMSYDIGSYSISSRLELLNNVRSATDSYRDQQYQYRQQSGKSGGLSTVGSMVYSTTSSEATKRTKQHQQHRQQEAASVVSSSRLRVTFDDEYSCSRNDDCSNNSRWGKRRDPPTTQDDIDDDDENTSVGQYSNFSSEMVSSIDGPLHSSSKHRNGDFRRIV